MGRRGDVLDKLAWLMDQGVVRSWMFTADGRKVDVVGSDGKVHLWSFGDVVVFWSGVYAARAVFLGAPGHRDAKLTMVTYPSFTKHLMTAHGVSAAMVHSRTIEHLSNLHLIRHDMDLLNYRGNPEHEHPIGPQDRST